MQKYYICVALCSFLYYSYGKIENEDVYQPGTNKIYKLDQNIINLLEQKLPTLFLSIQALDTKMSEDLERNRNFQAVILKKINYLEENINRQFHVLTKNISKTAEEIINYKSDTLKRISDLEGNFIQKIEMLEEIPTKFQENINFKLDTMAKNISQDWEVIINCKSDALKNVTNFDENKYPQLGGNDNEIPDKVHNASAVMENTLKKTRLPCKEVNLGYDFSSDYSTDNVTYNYVTLKKNSTSHITYFEMHIAIKADQRVFIALCARNLVTAVCYNIRIGWEDNQYTTLKPSFGRDEVQRIYTPNILSITQYRSFNIKINDGTLEFSKEGDNSPLITYHDDRLSLNSTFRFFHWEKTEASIRYDCPAPVEELPCKEVKIAYSYSPQYSMHNMSLNYVTVQKNSSSHLTYFEMHIAIKADQRVFIELCGEGNSAICYYLYIGWEDNQYTTLKPSFGGEEVQRIYTPNILSINQFRAFYIKINEGTLEFSKEGDNSPLISYYDDLFSLDTTFRFFHWEFTEANIRYDCPVPVEGTS